MGFTDQQKSWSVPLIYEQTPGRALTCLRYKDMCQDPLFSDLFTTPETHLFHLVAVPMPSIFYYLKNMLFSGSIPSDVYG